eukprot:scaffold102342_cov37-Tisochrysis_lutea.AAC.1
MIRVNRGSWHGHGPNQPVRAMKQQSERGSSRCKWRIHTFSRTCVRFLAPKREGFELGAAHRHRQPAAHLQQQGGHDARVQTSEGASA